MDRGDVGSKPVFRRGWRRHPFRASQPETQPPASYALGWMVWHLDTGDVINHGGDNPGFKAFAAASVARKSGLVLMTNGDAGLQVLNKLVLDDVTSEFL